MYTGKQIFMETLLAEGVKYIFGNPGTTELPLIDSLRDYPQIEYIMTLQEAVAVSMADAYAHASGNVAVVNLHVAPGLGNGLGSVYNAWEGQTPLIVTAGQQDNRLRLREPLLGHDLVAMAAPLVKWSVQAETADELPLILHRAFKTARQAPSGPVFVSLPINVMEQRTERPPFDPSVLYSRSAPDPCGVEHAADLLVAAKAPVLVCGDKVAPSDAVADLIELAEALGAPVFAVVLPARINFPNQHPHFRGRLGNDQALIGQALDGSDVVLLVGGEFFEEIWFVERSPLDGKQVIQIDPAPGNLGRNYRVDCGLVADPKLALRALCNAIEDRATPALRRRASEGRTTLAAKKRAEREEQRARANAAAGNRPMSAATLMAKLDEALPGDVSIAGEPITAGVDMMRTLTFEGPGDYLADRGGGIGQGLPSGIGIKLARPERPALCISGDGSALYTIQALWSAAHHDIPVVFLILSNRSYRILKLNMNRYREEFAVSTRGYQHLDLSEPLVDFVDLAKGFGVDGARIESPDEVGPALSAAFASGKPWLLDVVIDGSV